MIKGAVRFHHFANQLGLLTPSSSVLCLSLRREAQKVALWVPTFAIAAVLKILKSSNPVREANAEARMG